MAEPLEEFVKTPAELKQLDVDEKHDLLTRWWAAYNTTKNIKKDGWVIIADEYVHCTGSGFDSFKEALLAVSEGYGWDSENACKANEDKNEKKRAFPCLGLFNFATADNPKRVQTFAFAYCDDSKKYGGFGLGRKMRFAQWKNTAKAIFDGSCKGGIHQWASEGDILYSSIENEFNKGDRL